MTVLGEVCRRKVSNFYIFPGIQFPLQNKVTSGSMTKVTCSMTKGELHHFHLVNTLLVKS